MRERLIFALLCRERERYFNHVMMYWEDDKIDICFIREREREEVCAGSNGS